MKSTLDNSSEPIFTFCGGRAVNVRCAPFATPVQGCTPKCTQRHVFRRVVEEGHVRAGVELQANRPHSVGQADRDDERLGQTAHRSRAVAGASSRDVLSFYICAHGGGVVEAEQAVRIVDQHVELLEKILSEDALNIEAWRLQILEVVHQDLLVG